MNSRKRMLAIVVMFLLLGTTSVLAGQAQQAAVKRGPTAETANNGFATAGQTDSAKPQLQRRNPRYHLNDGDILQLDFPLSPEFNQTVTIAPDGYITLQGAGDLYIKGLTVPQLRQSLQKAYSKILHQPIISITLKDFEQPFFVVGGQVGKPGKYDLRGDTSVLEALEIAGGITDSAKHSQVLLFRRVSKDWVEVKKIDVKRMLRGQDLAEDTDLQPGDMLFVPKNLISKIGRFIPVPGMGMYLNGM